MAEAANDQQRNRNRRQIDGRAHSEQDERRRREAEPALPGQGPGAAQTSGLHRDRPNLFKGEQDQNLLSELIENAENRLQIEKKSACSYPERW